jgi:L-aminopeptidase/D-esterase-like protein
MDGNKAMKVGGRAAEWGIAIAMIMAPSSRADDLSKGLTAVPGIKVGHFTLTERPTGCTVVIAEAGAVGGVDVRGGAPGTRETDLLQPANLVEQVHAVVLAGGSAFGLEAATGVMRLLEERGIGYDVGVAKVPIVPAAILFDLGVGQKPAVRPTAECGYRAATTANSAAVEEGSIGAGAGATVGKLLGPGRAMKAGVGTAALGANGLVVAALVAVNAAGDVIDPDTGKVVAGVRTADGRGLADARALVRSGQLSRAPGQALQHTTIGVVATNARLTKAQAQKVAQMAHDGLARAIHPVHLPIDGDTLFALATGERPAGDDLGTIGAMAADVVAAAVVRSARMTQGIPGYPAARDLESAATGR